MSTGSEDDQIWARRKQGALDLAPRPSSLATQIGSTSWDCLCYKTTPQNVSISSTSTINRVIIDIHPWTVALLLLGLLLFWLLAFVCACSLDFLTRQVWPGHTCKDKKEALCARTPFFTSSLDSEADGQLFIFLQRKPFISSSFNWISSWIFGLCSSSLPLRREPQLRAVSSLIHYTLLSLKTRRQPNIALFELFGCNLIVFSNSFGYKIDIRGFLFVFFLLKNYFFSWCFFFFFWFWITFHTFSVKLARLKWLYYRKTSHFKPF